MNKPGKHLFFTLVAMIFARVDIAKAANVFEYHSQNGHYIGQGWWRSLSVHTTFRPDTFGHAITLSVRDWYSSNLSYDFILDAPIGHELAPGYYPNAERFATSTAPGLDFSGESRGFNQSLSGFLIREISLQPDGRLSVLAVDFIQTGDGNSATLQGWLRYNSELPIDYRLMSIPEPTTASLMFFSGLLFLRRRRAAS